MSLRHSGLDMLLEALHHVSSVPPSGTTGGSGGVREQVLASAARGGFSLAALSHMS